MNGRNSPIPGVIATFSWQGTGLLRLFSAKWEVIAFDGGEKGQGNWMVTFQHKTILTSPAVNIACRSKNGLDGDVIELVQKWLASLGDDQLAKAGEEMYSVEHT